MSTSSRSSRSDTDDSIFDIEELLHIEARCRELRREKDLLKETQSQSFDLIKRLELHVRKLNEARMADNRQIQELQRELNNCHQEIDYLQDQLNTRNAYVDSLEERLDSFEMKLADVDLMEDEIVSLREELNKSNSECEFLMQELETKATELQLSCLHVEKLEESISSAALEYQCDIESMRLEMMALEQRCFESNKSEEESSRENTSLNEWLHVLQLRLDDAQKNIKCSESENKQCRERLDAFENEAKFFCERVEEHLKGRLKGRDSVTSHASSNSGDDRKVHPAELQAESCGAILGPLFLKLLTVGTSDADVRTSTDRAPDQVHVYEELVKQLKEELKEEKLRAKDEAEDLAQEMAELRYQMSELLEEERKRRACIEQASLHRISQLEAQLQAEQRKSIATVRAICEA